MQTPADPNELMRPAEVQRFLRISRALVYRWASDGTIPAVRIPMHTKNGAYSKDLVRFRRADVLAFIERHRRPSTT